MKPLSRLLFGLILAAAFPLPRESLACTGIKLVARDGTVIRARTLEFGLDLESEVLGIPRGFARRGTTPQGATGVEWKSKYASLDANGVGLPYLFDGVNEKGLTIGLHVNFSVVNRPPVQVGGLTLTGFGQGTGMLGLPGDFTPPSRLVRAVAYSTSVFPSETGEEAILQAFHILNNFDIPKGSARDGEKDARGNITADYTLWTSAIHSQARRFYFRTYENSQIRSVDLMKLPLEAAGITHLSMKGNEVVRSLTP